ncbi:YitT family protein [Mycoplasma iguanae]|uniref:YitT family protein n=1 Tax=Mycoplasma iguanae TaxID=292461 RepID=A0ABY5RAH6_9MOLU|nr:YitT family protein [Mycoplasma iguanae]UVD81757.1 YitT family protein [Mycoplasma iguanae]
MFKFNNKKGNNPFHLSSIKFHKKLWHNHCIDNERIILTNNHKLNILDFIRRYPYGLLMMIISSLIFSLGINIFVIRSQTIPTGLTAIPIVLSYIWPSIQNYFSLIYLAVNLPLIIIFFNKVKKSFIYLTLFWMICQIGWEQIINIKVINNFLIHHTTIVPGWTAQSSNNLWLVIVYTLIGVLLATIAIGLSWKFGGSSGGTDIISYYYSTRKQKAIGKFMLTISLSIAFCSLLLLFILGKTGLAQHSSINELFGIRTFATLIWVVTLSTGVNIIYPKYKKVLVTVYTTMHEDIRNHLNEIKYWHSFNIWEGISGYTGRKIQKIETVVLVLEVNFLIKHIKAIDPQSWITVREVSILSGKLDTTKID